MSKAKISVKLAIDESKSKVLFAEAGKECVDFFFHILSLPLGSVVGFLTKASMVGSIGCLYGSLESLSTDYVQEGLNKDCLLNPIPPVGSASNVPLLTINSAPSDPRAKTFYTCHQIFGKGDYRPGPNYANVSDAAGAKCPYCRMLMDRILGYVVPTPADTKEKNVGGYVKGVVTYMIIDDLSVQPMSTLSSITLLKKFNVKDVDRLEEREVTLDINLGVALLKASLMSKTVLTDVFLGNKAAGTN